MVRVPYGCEVRNQTPMGVDMSLLTTQEIYEIAGTGNEGHCFGDLAWQDCTEGFARAIEAAILAKLETLEADAERLDWLQKALFVNRWNGVVGSGCATQWSIAPDYRHTVAKMKTRGIEIDFRAAIDAAKGGQHEDA